VISVFSLSCRANRSNWALGEIGNPAVRRALERAQLQDPAVGVQTETVWVLTRIPEQAATAAS
jgi:hypothetical protein